MTFLHAGRLRTEALERNSGQRNKTEGRSMDAGYRLEIKLGQQGPIGKFLNLGETQSRSCDS
jgi:hypothetical protein